MEYINDKICAFCDKKGVVELKEEFRDDRQGISRKLVYNLCQEHFKQHTDKIKN